MTTQAPTQGHLQEAKALLSELSQQDLFELISSATTQLLTPPKGGQGEDEQGIAEQFRWANQMQAHLLACQVKLAGTCRVDCTDAQGKNDLKHRLVSDYSVPVPIANSIVAGVEATALINDSELLADGVVPVDVLAMAVKSVKNHLREDVQDVDTREIFADIANRLKIKSSVCSSQGTQVSRGQARWVVQQVLREHPDKVGTGPRKRRTKTVHVGVRAGTRKVEVIRCGELLDGEVMSRVDSGWMLSDQTVSLMGERDVVVRVKAIVDPIEPADATSGTNPATSNKQERESTIPTPQSRQTNLTRHQRRKLRKKMARISDQSTTQARSKQS